MTAAALQEATGREPLCCGNCKSGISYGAGYVRCRRYPPVATGHKAGNTANVTWPILAQQAWCGEYQFGGQTP